MEKRDSYSAQELLLHVACLIIVVRRHDGQKFLEQQTASIFECSSHGIFLPAACSRPLFPRICSTSNRTRSAGNKSTVKRRRDDAGSIGPLTRRGIDGKNIVVRGNGPAYLHRRSSRQSDKAGRYVAAVRNRPRRRYHRRLLLSRLFYTRIA